MNKKTSGITEESDDLIEKPLPEEKFEDSESDIREELDIPVKDRKLITHPYDFITRSLVDQIEDGSLILADKFQRRKIWDDTKASRLIESLLLNVPIPVCYFAEIDNGAYSVIDGQQRLTTIYRYLKNLFPLRGLRVRPELNKKRFSELDQADKRLINSRSIRCIVVLKESHQDIRFDVFERLNSNSVRLNAQELRNSLYRGPLNDLLRDLSSKEELNKDFLWIRNVEDIDKRMHDCELILRFFAFHFEGYKYKGALASFLDAYLKKGARFDQKIIDEHKSLFLETVRKVKLVFDNKAFRRYDSKSGWENLINRAIYDVIMLSFAVLDDETIVSNKDRTKEAFQRICQDKEFNLAITSGTQAVKAVQTRIDRWVNMLNEVGIICPKIRISAEQEG